MRVLDRAVLVIVLVASACAHDPDPRNRTLAQAMRDGYGGWIVVERRGSFPVAGELISVRPDGAEVLTAVTPPTLVFVALAEIQSADVWAYAPDHGVTAWGVLGAVSAVSHGFWLVFSFPAWALTTSLSQYYQSQTPLYQYPKSSWSELAKWARFPQGRPEMVGAAELVPRPIPDAVESLHRAQRYAVDHGIAIETQTMQRPVYERATRTWVFTWALAPGNVVTIRVPEVGEITVGE